MRLRVLLIDFSLDVGCGVNCLLNSFVHLFALFDVDPLNEMLTLFGLVLLLVSFLMVCHRLSVFWLKLHLSR